MREHRLLATAYVSTHDYPQGPAAAETRLALAPNDAQPSALRGEANAGLGDPEGALADRRRAVELDGEDIGALYSTAFLLKRLGRLTEPMQTWRNTIDLNERHGDTLHNERPRQELKRLEAL